MCNVQHASMENQPLLTLSLFFFSFFLIDDAVISAVFLNSSVYIFR